MNPKSILKSGRQTAKLFITQNQFSLPGAEKQKEPGAFEIFLVQSIDYFRYF